MHIISDIKDLDKVLTALKAGNDFTADWKVLGPSLGLYQPTIKTIERNNKQDDDNGLNECLSAWLKLKDGVEAKGGATWSSLVTALRGIGENAVANRIEKNYN